MSRISDAFNNKKHLFRLLQAETLMLIQQSKP